VPEIEETRKMKKWIRVAIPVAAIVVSVAWHAFRPERLVVNRSVNEAFPSGKGGSPPQSLVSGQFYSILHPTAGTATIYQGRKNYGAIAAELKTNDLASQMSYRSAPVLS
jgi:hypothetical protein